MAAIFKREFKSYFHSFIGSLFIGIVLCITGIYVTVYNLLSGYPKLSYALSGIIFIFIISVPILTMRILAEEKRQKTDQLILTAPISVGKIVAGKFLALGVVFTIPVLVICVYPLVLSGFGTVFFLESYIAVFAFYLYGLTCIAIGVFISSLTESQVIAAVISFAVLFLGYVMAGICNMISSTGNILTKILGAFDLIARFNNLVEGTFDLKSVVYYISIILLVLFLTTQSIQKRRYSVSVNSLKMGAYSSALVTISIIVAVFLNLLVAEIPSKYTTFDVTSNKLFTLSDETEELLSNLQENVTIYVLSNESSQDTTLKKTLEQYKELSKHVNISYVDPLVNPKFYTQYTDASVSRNSLIVVSDKRSKVVDYGSVYETSVNYTTYESTVTGYDGEGQITSAIAYVTSDNMPKMYILEGHGELAFETDFNDTIAKANIDYESINLLQHDSIPEDAEGIIINSPTSDFSEDDTNKVLDYLQKGGNAFIISTWTEKDMTNFHKILDYYSVSVADGLVLEGAEGAYYQSPFYILPVIESDTITSSLGDTFIFAPYAQGFVLPEETEEGLSLTPLLSTSDQSYARADVDSTTDYAKQETDVAGPFTLGVKAVKTNGGAESTAVIYSSENLFTDAANAMVSGANMKLFAGSLGELTEETEGIAVPAKSYEEGYLTIPQSYIILIGLLITVIIPLAVLAGGFIVWFKRRKA
ncbi:MAG: ABC transporter permease [Clostridiales bacterium]|nr:ABC transporter permease [Clostridiales bacterium]